MVTQQCCKEKTEVRFPNVQNLNVVICAHGIDSKDVGEALMAYKWISRLSEFVNLWVITNGSRLHETTGLEDNPRVKLTVVKPVVTFSNLAFRFERAVRPNYLEFYFRARRAIRAIVAQEHIDLGHQLMPRTVRHTPVFANLGIPYIVGPVHGGLQPPKVMAELSAKEEPWLAMLRHVDRLRRRFDPVLRRAFSQAERVLVSAPYVQNIMPLDCVEKCDIVSGVAIDPPSMKDRIDRHDGQVRLIFVGRIVPDKGIELLIRAMAECQPGSCVLSVFGKGPLREYCEKLSQELGVDKYVTWKGFVDRSLVLKAYEEHDVFVLPTVKEPAPSVVIEAMAAGLPVVCVDAGGPAYSVVSDCGLKIGLADRRTMVADLARAIDFMITHHDERVAMGFQARRRVQKHFTWDVVVGRVLEIYNEVANETAK